MWGLFKELEIAREMENVHSKSSILYAYIPLPIFFFQIHNT